MNPIEVKRRYPKQTGDRWFHQFFASSPIPARCESCGGYISERMRWVCGICQFTIDDATFAGKTGEELREAIMRHSVFGCCPSCNQEPPAVICSHCRFLNPLTTTPYRDDHAAREVRPDAEQERVALHELALKQKQDKLASLSMDRDLKQTELEISQVDRRGETEEVEHELHRIRQDKQLIQLQAELDRLKFPPEKKKLYDELVEAIGYAAAKRNADEIQDAYERLAAVIREDASLSEGQRQRLLGELRRYVRTKLGESSI